MSAAQEDEGLESAAILLMTLGEEQAAEVFKHLAPREVQRLGETITRMKAVPRERVIPGAPAGTPLRAVEDPYAT